MDTMEQSVFISGPNSERTILPVTIDDLPTEMLWEIFSYLDLKDLVSACCVSGRWKDVGNGAPLLARQKYIITPDEDRSEIAETLQSIPNLRNVEISFDEKEKFEYTLSRLKFCTDIRDFEIHVATDIDSTLLQEIVKLPNLNTLSVPLWSPSQKVINQTGACLKLRKLDFGAFQSDIDLSPIAKGCPYLRELRISCITYKSAEDNSVEVERANFSKNTAHALSECIRLETVGCTCIHPNDMETFLDAIACLSGLKSLYLTLFDNLTQNMAMKLSNCSFSSTLRALNISCNGLTPEFSRTIVSSLTNVAVLRVHIWSKYIIMEGLRNLLEMKNLKILEIDSWPLSEDLFETLLKCKQIKHLAIMCCSGLNDQKAIRLVQEIELRYLEIIECDSLTDEFLKSFPCCETLKVLIVDVTDPSEQTIADLKSRLPSTRIVCNCN